MQGFPQPSQSSEQEKLKCPRCDSSNTKFCYYNNYNLSQPRHFCKSCRRYWTKGGALRNIPVGGGSRKNSKRGSATAAKRPASSDEKSETFLSLKGDNSSGQGQFGDFTEGVGRNETLSPLKEDDFFGQGHFGQGQFGGFSGMSVSFSSLLASSSSEAQYGSLLDGLGPNGLSLQMSENFGDPGPGQNVDPHGAGFLNIGGGGGGGYWGGGGGDGGCWGGGGDWPDLAM